MKKDISVIVAVLAFCSIALAGNGFYSQTTDPTISWKVTDNYSLWLQNNYSKSVRVKYTYCNDNRQPPQSACVGPLYTPWIGAGQDQIVTNVPGIDGTTRVVATVIDQQN